MKMSDGHAVLQVGVPELEDWIVARTRHYDDSFISTMPLTISTAAPMRIGVTASPKATMPTMKAPMAPIPVQIV